ncbi:YraN family protein [Synechococcales cyanobacterium C]|uniref:UPF0102 protein GS597_11860 n=1 Tax=Petrachloros mirabilis ULC683 TaxID=2781853 RepID=A0A8K2A0H9_9CYAN|nr:YraN family protein [Petrachloros mirabilis]NCJ07187.1 YraN family protein [Petrachloros mirabilis ULC683]
MSDTSPSPAPSNSTPTSRHLGQWGEAIVGHWLTQQGCHLLAQGWRCRWGELDWIAQYPLDQTHTPPLAPEPTLIFVEVKTRSRYNWDANGLLAISPQKQAKLWRTAQYYLAQHPQKAELPCRFDVALVTYQAPARSTSPYLPTAITLPTSVQIALNQPLTLGNFCFTLDTYLPNVLAA